MNIAIIGGGVSGLSTAFYLRKKFPDAERNPITVFESADEVGGNANTFKVRLPKKGVPGDVVERWVDMGVNDFNLGTYKALVDLWEELGFMKQGNPCPTAPDYCRPLINSESFATGDSRYRYTIDETGFVSAPPGSTALNDIPDLRRDIERFKKELGRWYETYKPEGKNPITVEGWIRSSNMPFSEAFIYNNLYPRINGMYFTVEDPQTGRKIPPADMPLWMVAHYYILQEAYGQTPVSPCVRQYFVDGSRKWLIDFAKILESPKYNVTVARKVPKLSFFKKPENKISIHAVGSEVGLYDKVIFATHANDNAAMLNTDDFRNDEIYKALSKFKYEKCDILVHQDATFLGPNDFGCTYNIHIYDYNKENKGKYPYNISYIVNKHQNDAANPNPDRRTDPEFYLTINPYWNSGVIPTEKVLKLWDNPTWSAGMQMSHCKLDQNAMDGQLIILDEQLMKKVERTYYFGGSFAKGAGLHVECIIQAKDIAEKIFDKNYQPTEIYDFTGKREYFAPKYILDAISSINNK